MDANTTRWKFDKKKKDTYTDSKYHPTKYLLTKGNSNFTREKIWHTTLTKRIKINITSNGKNRQVSPVRLH